MLIDYFPILVFLIIGIVLGVVPLLLGAFVGPHKPDKEKNSPYECGFNEFEDARIPFDVRYYLVAILFIIFDLEIAFMFPWAVDFRYLVDHFGGLGFWSMMMFLALLVVGFIYEWKKGALEWE